MKSFKGGLAAGCAAVSVYIIVSIVFVMKTGSDAGGILSFPGMFLVRSFRYASFYIPAYLLAAGAILVVPGTHTRYITGLFISIIPFLTLSLFFQVVSGRPAGPAAVWCIGFFGRRGSAFFLFFLFLLETVLSAWFIPAGGGSRPVADEEPDTKPPAPREDRAGWEPVRILPAVEEEEPGIPDTGSADEEGVPDDGDEDFEERDEEEFEDEEVDALELPEEAEDDVPFEEAPDTGAVAKKKVPYAVPLLGLLDEYPDGQYWIVDEGTRKAAEILKETLEEFKISAEVTGISKGPVITMFEMLPAPGVKLSKIVNLADNIALRLAASRVRIVAPIPGKHAVGIEVPNRHRAIVSFREMIEDEGSAGDKMEIPVILGKDIAGGSRIIDLVHTPHLLIAGATGSGKSVCVNSIICSVLYNRKPSEVRIMLIDPKIVELKLYNDIPHLLTPVITEPKRAFQALQYCIYEMERRYSLLDNLGVRDVRSYNRKVKERRIATEPLPYILIIIDEFADLMATTGKEMEATIARLAAMSRAVGLHLVLATQRPSVDVITGLIKANIPSRIAFMVAGKFDSRIIIDQVGAEKLLGRGDMLFTSAWDPNPVRIQGAFLSEIEVERITDHVRTLGEPDYIDDEIFFDEEDDGDFSLVSDGPGDPLMDSAVGIVVEAGKASASYLQRRLKIGYNRAARLVEQMEEMGIVGPANGSKPRDILHVPDRYL